MPSLRLSTPSYLLAALLWASQIPAATAQALPAQWKAVVGTAPYLHESYAALEHTTGDKALATKEFRLGLYVNR